MLKHLCKIDNFNQLITLTVITIMALTIFRDTNILLGNLKGDKVTLQLKFSTDVHYDCACLQQAD